MSLITEVDILDEAKDNFLTYAEEVLTDRAIPAAEDGLLSAQRKILWTMEDYLKMDNKSKTKKCNAIIGSTLATSYFHGDIACYGVLRKMA
jgi:DNA gyrase subunit A